MKLMDRIAGVTSGGRGISKAMALAFAREEAHLVPASRRLSEAQATVAEARAMGQRALAMMLDVPRRREVDAVGAKDTLGAIRLTEDVCRCYDGLLLTTVRIF